MFLIIVMTSWGIHMSKHHDVHVKYMQFILRQLHLNKAVCFKKQTITVSQVKHREINKEINGKKSILKRLRHCPCVSCFHYKGRKRGI